MGNPFNQPQGTENFVERIYLDVNAGKLYKTVRYGPFAYGSEPLPDDQQIAGIPANAGPPDPGVIPPQMAELIARTDTWNVDVVIATSARSTADGWNRYNNTFVCQGYMDAMTFWRDQPDTYEQPTNPTTAGYYAICNYAATYALIKSGAGVPPPNPCNYSLLRQRR